jgi:hypothetical protein
MLSKKVIVPTILTSYIIGDYYFKGPIRKTYDKHRYCLLSYEKINNMMLCNHQIPINYLEKYYNKLDHDILFKFQNLPEEFVEKHVLLPNKNINLTNKKYDKEYEEEYKKICNVYKYQQLDENILEKYMDLTKHFSKEIIENQDLSNNFIEKHLYPKGIQLDENLIIKNQILSEDIITNNISRRNIHDILTHQKLTENVIDKIINNNDLYDDYTKNLIIMTQELSEDFIKKNYNKFKYSFDFLMHYQNFSEKFIDWYLQENAKEKDSYSASFEFIKDNIKNQTRINILKYQKLSKDFILQHSDLFKDVDDYHYEYIKTNWKYFEITDKITKLKQDDYDYIKNNWKNFEISEKINKLKQINRYKIYSENDKPYIIAYKSVRNNMHSIQYPSLYKYQVGQTYINKYNSCDQEENSFGFHAHQLNYAKEFGQKYRNKLAEKYKILKVKIYVDDLMMFKNGEIRCGKMEVLECKDNFEYLQ